MEINIIPSYSEEYDEIDSEALKELYAKYGLAAETVQTTPDVSSITKLPTAEEFFANIKSKNIEEQNYIRMLREKQILAERYAGGEVEQRGDVMVVSYNAVQK